jgi:hypothetical protein
MTRLTDLLLIKTWTTKSDSQRIIYLLSTRLSASLFIQLSFWICRHMNKRGSLDNYVRTSKTRIGARLNLWDNQACRRYSSCTGHIKTWEIHVSILKELPGGYPDMPRALGGKSGSKLFGNARKMQNIERFKQWGDLKRYDVDICEVY